MSWSDEVSWFAGELLRALRCEPLGIGQLAAALGVISAAVGAELEGLVEAGLVQTVSVESGGAAWGLTVKGYARIAAERRS